jgi:hypothetical protein
MSHPAFPILVGSEFLPWTVSDLWPIFFFCKSKAHIFSCHFKEKKRRKKEKEKY